MKRSARIKRRARHQKKTKVAGLNLVSLMDIFTILVFFLLINSGNVEVLATDDSLDLPSSNSERAPEETLVVLVNRGAIVVGGRPVAELNTLELTNNGEIVALSEELQHQASRKTNLTEREEQDGFAVTIMGDKDTPYSLLKSIIQTCSAENYRDIALAVNQIPGAKAEDVLTSSNTDILSAEALSQSPIAQTGQAR